MNAMHRTIPCARSLAVPRRGCEDLRVATPSFFSKFSLSRGVNGAITALIVFGIAAVAWIPHLPDSLWLDETLTYWVVKDGLVATLDRAVHYQSQAAYYALMWFWTRIAGTSEIALRLPSLLAAFGVCVALARLGRRLTRDRETGWLAVVVFVSGWNAFRESVDARSYMPGLFVLLIVTLGLVRWIDEGRWREVWICGVLGALLPHLHVFYALVYPAFGLYAVLRWPGPRKDLLPQLGVFFGLLVLGALLFLPAALTLTSHGASYSFAPPPNVRVFIGMFVWTAPIAGLLTGLCLAGGLGGRAIAGAPEGEQRPQLSSAVAWLLTAWIFVPMVTLYAVSTWTDISVFISRYLIEAAPAVSLVYAVALRGIDSGRARVLAAIVIAGTSLVLNERPPDDFRGAVAAVNEFVAGDPSVPVLFASGLIEGEDEGRVRDPDYQAYLIAPASYYPIEGRTLAVPRRMYGQPLALQIVEPLLEARRPFAAIEWFGNGARILPWLIQQAEAVGYRVERRGFGAVRVVLFRPQR
jgi:hypothetical protein